jgi:uncharacterized protein (TIGR02001 family)
MMNSKSVLRGLTAALLGGAAVAMVSASAMAADLGGMKDGPMAEPTADHTITVNGGITTDYVFRGISQSNEKPAVFAGLDIAYGMFYAGTWSSSVDDFVSQSNIEIDVYGGIKKSYRNVDFDFGLIYYAYPSDGYPVNISYLELKAAATAKVYRDISLTGTVFWSPDYSGEVGSTWTFEGKFAAPLPFWGLTLGGAVGYVTSADDGLGFSSVYGDDNYTYWNIGLFKTFREHYTVDVRYWGSNLDNAPTHAVDKLVDDRVLATFTFNY